MSPFFSLNILDIPVNTNKIASITPITLRILLLFFFPLDKSPTGVTATSIFPNIKSIIKAKIQAGIAPAKIILLFTVCTPVNTRYPRPPAPIKAAKVINPTDVTADILTPDIINGKDTGIFILINVCLFVNPIPLAASNIFSSILVSAVKVFFTIGKREYKTTVVIAGTVPIPSNGISNPNKAIDGTACNVLINPNIGFLRGLIFVISIPKGIPINIPKIPNVLPPTVIASNTQIADNPIEFPTTIG